jgi:hypothetical protein
VLAGCGQETNTAAPGGTVTSPSSSSSSSSPAGKPATVRGTVEAGVEAGCLILNGEDGMAYLLLGGDRGLLLSGVRLEVAGSVERGLLTTCQQGTPLKVTSVRRI